MDIPASSRKASLSRESYFIFLSLTDTVTYTVWHISCSWLKIIIVRAECEPGTTKRNLSHVVFLNQNCMTKKNISGKKPKYWTHTLKRGGVLYGGQMLIKKPGPTMLKCMSHWSNAICFYWTGHGNCRFTPKCVTMVKTKQIVAR